MNSNLEKIQKLMKEKNSDLKIEKEEKKIPLGSGKVQEPKEKKEKKRVHKKPIALKELENKDRLLSLKKKQLQGTTSEEVNTNDMGYLLDNETNKIFFRPWNKLEKGLKCNRINKYLNEQEEYELKKKEKEDLKKMLYSAINKGILTKNTDVNYNKDEGKIIKINILLYDEKKRKFKLKQETTKKQKTANKSKSNVERLLKK